jgi:muramoyltetrapeptide carboxypeptidase
LQITKKDKIVVWAPSSPAPYLFPKRFERSLENLKKNGYINISIGDSCKKNIKYHKNFAMDMANEFHEYLLDDEIKAIIFAVGGWTTITILPFIDWEIVRDNPKPIVGYSDATALLLAINKKTNLQTFHGPMIIPEWGEDEGPWDYTKSNFESMLLTPSQELKLNPPEYWTQEILWWDKEDNRRRKASGKGAWRTYKHGYCNGELVGGNLNVMSLMLGSEYIPDFTDKILFLETEGYSPDKFLAFLTQLELNNVFNEINGLIIGRHSNPIAASSGATSFNEILDFMFQKYDFPIILDVDLGHTEPMITLPIGGHAHINTEKNVFSVGKRSE